MRAAVREVEKKHPFGQLSYRFIAHAAKEVGVDMSGIVWCQFYKAHGGGGYNPNPSPSINVEQKRRRILEWAEEMIGWYVDEKGPKQ